MNSGDWTLEDQARGLGFRRVAGIDEAGRGSLAGPVVAGAVILREDFPSRELPDSKRLRKTEREKWHRVIHRFSHAVSFATAGPEEIDNWNILEATRVAMERAVQRLEEDADLLLIDAVRLEPGKISQVSITKGDEISISIAAASIIAKVERDRIMAKLDRKYPRFHFRTNQGYGTLFHRRVLQEHGPSPVHRASFRPLADWITLSGSPVPSEKGVGF